MPLSDRFKPILRIVKIASIWASGTLFVGYHIRQTYNAMCRVVNPSVLEREKKYVPEYIYINDPTYNSIVQREQDKQAQQAVGFARIWKSLKHSLAWRLLWLCRHGNTRQRDLALEQLASFKNNKHWDCLKLAQAMDPATAVLLARTPGADRRYFLPPPPPVRRAALAPELVSFKLRDLILAAHAVNHHCCIEQFLTKYFANIQEQAVENDSVKPDHISERDLCIQCLDAIYHHISLFCVKEHQEDISAKTLVNAGLMTRLAEVLLRNKNDVDIDLGVLRILTILSVHRELLPDFFHNGFIGELTRLLQSQDVRLSSSAAVCLVNLSGEGCYRPGLFLLHPLYRTTKQHICDTLLIHGLRGGVFVTWRQRDKNCVIPVGIMEVSTKDDDCDPCIPEKANEPKFLDPELEQVMADLIEVEEERLLSDYDVVLHDLPIGGKWNEDDLFSFYKKSHILQQEEEDKCSHTQCWPKDWLPKDCSNLRILGLNYWSSLSEWLERCPYQTADIKTRSANLSSILVDAGVGMTGVPVVWLAHSMGGLIVKHVLVEGAQGGDTDLKKLAENTKAIFFYSTPHRGSAFATMPRAATAILWPSNEVRELREDSPLLSELQSAFLQYVDEYDWKTTSFVETRPTLVTAFKVPVHLVQSISADLGRGPFYELPLDHVTICKPATRQSILYILVLDAILKVTAKNVELKYSNPFIQYLIDNFWNSLNRQAEEMLKTVDEESKSSDSLHWFQQMLLDVFTDGFTD